MTGVGGSTESGRVAPEGAAHARLREAAAGLEGVFMAQLFQAMRSTVGPAALSGGPGGELFQAMLDERLAQAAAARQTRGLGEALYRQLARHLPEGA